MLHLIEDGLNHLGVNLLGDVRITGGLDHRDKPLPKLIYRPRHGVRNDDLIQRPHPIPLIGIIMIMWILLETIETQ